MFQVPNIACHYTCICSAIMCVFLFMSICVTLSFKVYKLLGMEGSKNHHIQMPTTHLLHLHYSLGQTLPRFDRGWAHTALGIRSMARCRRPWPWLLVLGPWLFGCPLKTFAMSGLFIFQRLWSIMMILLQSKDIMKGIHISENQHYK